MASIFLLYLFYVNTVQSIGHYYAPNAEECEKLKDLNPFYSSVCVCFAVCVYVYICFCVCVCVKFGRVF